MVKREKKQKAPEDLLGPIEHLVLKAVMVLGEDVAYGMSVFEAIRTVYPPISFGSVYTALERLTWKGYLASRLGESEPTRGGRARKYFRVTGLGKRVLEATRNILESPMVVEGAATS
jgi:PadR family transcriptional regulator PadR